MKKCEIRQATREDIEAFYGEPPVKSMRAFVALLDGAVIAIAGVYKDPFYLVAFSDMKDAMRSRKKDIARLTRANMAAIEARARPVIAFASCKEANATAFLQKLGFRYEGTTVNGETYSWQPQR